MFAWEVKYLLGECVQPCLAGSGAGGGLAACSLWFIVEVDSCWEFVASASTINTLLLLNLLINLVRGMLHSWGCLVAKLCGVSTASKLNSSSALGVKLSGDVVGGDKVSSIVLDSLWLVFLLLFLREPDEVDFGDTTSWEVGELKQKMLR